MMNPTDEELMSLLPLADPQSIESTDLKFYLPKSLPSDWDRDDFIAPPKAVIAFARAVLARYRHQPTSPVAEGEVAELVAWMEDEADQYDCIRQAAETSHKLRRAAYLLAHHHPAPPTEGEVGELVEGLNLISDGMDAMGHESDSWFVARAAHLLEQRYPAPVLVSERLQQLEDLAADAVRGLQYIEQTHGRLYGVGWDRVYEKADRLQATAKPLPEEERAE